MYVGGYMQSHAEVIFRADEDLNLEQGLSRTVAIPFWT